MLQPLSESTRAILGLGETERQAQEHFASGGRYHSYFSTWEQGYHFLSRIFPESSIHWSYAGLAGLFSEAHTSLRTSFICNTTGYHEDAATLLRRVHESTVRMIAIKIDNQQYWKLIMNSGTQRAENIIGVNWQTIYKVASSFAHGDVMQAMEAGKAVDDGEKYDIPYGPQLNEQKFQWAANISIFWLHILILALPRVFHRQVKQVWIDDQQKFTDLTLEFLSNLPHPSLKDQAQQLYTVLEKIGTLEPLKE